MLLELHGHCSDAFFVVIACLPRLRDRVAIERTCKGLHRAVRESNVRMRDHPDVKAAAVRLGKSHTCTHMAVSSCDVALFTSLRVNAVLNELRLCDNQIGDTGATALADALKVNAVLNELYLSYNQIGPTGAVALAESLKVNAVLKKLAFGDNSELGADGKAALNEAVSGFEVYV